MGILTSSQFGLRLQNLLNIKVGSPNLPSRGNQDLFSSKLEGRLDNYKRGKVAPEDYGVDVEISSRSASVSEALAATDPKALKNYNALLSGLTYTKSARVVTNVEFALRKLSNIPSEEEAQAQTDKVLEAFNLSTETKPQAS